MFPEKLHLKLNTRTQTNSLRRLGNPLTRVDFSSNDYLGFAKNDTLFKNTHAFLLKNGYTKNGATGSRLLTGNHKLYTTLETNLSTFHNSENALIFNSGYTANLGFFATVPQRGDIILYDEFCHASIRDGIQLSAAKAYKFKHNNTVDLEKKITLGRTKNPTETIIYVVTESVFSMDGDTPPLQKMAEFCQKHNCYFVVDEAHAVGIHGKNGRGYISKLNLESLVFARIITFGKALGCHGACILGSNALKQYLINFCRAFIYTTGLPPHNLANIATAYTYLNEKETPKILKSRIAFFNSELTRLQLQLHFITSHSAVHCCIIKGNDNVKMIAEKLNTQGYHVKPILSPTVPFGKERLRFCLHAFNTETEIREVLQLLATLLIS